MPVYRKKTADVEAIQFDGQPQTIKAIEAWTKSAKKQMVLSEDKKMLSLHAKHPPAKIGDYIVRGPKGKPGIYSKAAFEALYELAD